MHSAVAHEDWCLLVPPFGQERGLPSVQDVARLLQFTPAMAVMKQFGTEQRSKRPCHPIKSWLVGAKVTCAERLTEPENHQPQ